MLGLSKPTRLAGESIKVAKPKGGLTKWFKEDWVDIGSKKKGGGYVSAREDIIRTPSQPNGNLTVANLVRAALRNMRVERVAYGEPRPPCLRANKACSDFAVLVLLENALLMRWGVCRAQ